MTMSAPGFQKNPSIQSVVCADLSNHVRIVNELAKYSISASFPQLQITTTTPPPFLVYFNAIFMNHFIIILYKVCSQIKTPKNEGRKSQQKSQLSSMNRNMSKDVEKKKTLKYLMIDDDDAKEEIFAC